MEEIELVVHDLDYTSDYEALERVRQEHEIIRDKNENIRVANERQRIDNEESRKLAEQDREARVYNAIGDLKNAVADLDERVARGEFKGDKGDKGEQGPAGPQGPQGLPGDTPQKGVDYWTEADIEAIKEDTRAYAEELIGNNLDVINGEVV